MTKVDVVGSSSSPNTACSAVLTTIVINHAVQATEPHGQAFRCTSERDLKSMVQFTPLLCIALGMVYCYSTAPRLPEARQWVEYGWVYRNLSPRYK